MSPTLHVRGLSKLREQPAGDTGPRPYRGSDNPAAQAAAVSQARRLVLSDRTRTRGGRRSRRRTARVWEAL